MLAMTLHVLTYQGFKKDQKFWFLMTFLSIILCSGAEFLVHGLPYNPSNAVFLTIVTVIQFSLSPTLGILFIGALGLRKPAKYAFAFFSLNFLFEIIAAPFGLVFTFTEEGYARGEWFLVYGAFYAISLIYLLVGMIIVGKRFRHRDFWTIAMVIVILLGGIIPMSFFQINITYIAIAIASCVCYIYYNDLVQQDIKTELVTNQNIISTMQNHMISGLANLIESRDMETGEHISRTSSYVKLLAEHAREDGVYADQLTDLFISMLYTLAPMHDIGKILISDAILKKPGKLTPEEFETMKRHASMGGTVVREVLDGVTDEAYLSFASDVATYHHERWDGTGYPSGLKGEDIPLSARIMAIADVFDALISERCYKSAMPPDEACEVIRLGAGTHFDPLLVEVFLKHQEDFCSPVDGSLPNLSLQKK